VEDQYNLLCEYYLATLLYQASYPFVSLIAETITVDTAATTAADVGLHTISITSSSAFYPGTVADKTYTFVLNVQHCVVNTMTLPAISD
jgi:hypothetical protein